jgi:hypothetical protein
MSFGRATEKVILKVINSTQTLFNHLITTILRTFSERHDPGIRINILLSGEQASWICIMMDPPYAKYKNSDSDYIFGVMMTSNFL